jgi:hypothetical protein
MRAPRRKRPLPRKISGILPADVDLNAIATRVAYVGSPEHKAYPSSAGGPFPRPDASKCDPSFRGRESMLTEWIRHGIRSQYVSGPWDNGLPRYVWYLDESGGVRTVYEARLMNQGNGEYKGYPLNPDEWPDAFQ